MDYTYSYIGGVSVIFFLLFSPTESFDKVIFIFRIMWILDADIKRGFTSFPNLVPALMNITSDEKETISVYVQLIYVYVQSI